MNLSLNKIMNNFDDKSKLKLAKLKTVNNDV